MNYSDERELRPVIDNLLAEKGEMGRLKSLLHSRLSECGWQEEVKLACKKVIREKGVHTVTSEAVIEQVTPLAREKIPAEIKKELLNELKDAIIKELDKLESSTSQPAID